MSSAPSDFNARIIEEFRENAGHVGGRFDGTRLLLLHTEGARSATRHVTPVAYLADGDRYVIFASKAGAPTNPGWYHNLRAHPDTTIEVGTDTLEVTASVAQGDERERLYRAAGGGCPAVRRVPVADRAADPGRRAHADAPLSGVNRRERESRCPFATSASSRSESSATARCRSSTSGPGRRTSKKRRSSP